MKIIIIAILLSISSNYSIAQVVVNEVNINNLPIEHITLIGTAKSLNPFNTKIYVDYGQTMSWKEQTIKNSDGKNYAFNGMIDALNFMEKNGWKYVNHFSSEINGKMTYKYLLKRNEITSVSTKISYKKDSLNTQSIRTTNEIDSVIPEDKSINEPDSNKGSIRIGAYLGVLPISKYSNMIKAVTFEYNFSTVFALRGHLGFSGIGDSSKKTYGNIGVNAVYYPLNKENINIYLLGGISKIGFTTGLANFLPNIKAGIRYNFTPELGGFSEVGLGLSIINLGLSYKIK